MKSLSKRVSEAKIEDYKRTAPRFWTDRTAFEVNGRKKHCTSARFVSASGVFVDGCHSGHDGDKDEMVSLFCTLRGRQYMVHLHDQTEPTKESLRRAMATFARMVEAKATKKGGR